MMVGKSFKNGDLVWAKQPGQDNWPGRIEKPPKDLHPPSKKGYHLVKFFNTNKSVWLKNKAIVLHSEDMLQSFPKRKSASLKKAIEEITSLSQMAMNERSESEKLNQEVCKSAMPLNSSETQEEVKEIKEDVLSHNNPPSVINIDNSSDKKETCDTEGCPSPKLDEHLDNNESLDFSSSIQADNPVTLEQADVLMTSVDAVNMLLNSTAPELCPTKQVDSSESIEKSDVVMSSVDAADVLQNSPIPEVCNIEQPTSLTGVATLREETADLVNPKIGFLGLGRMGSAIVRDLMMAGYDVTVWNRTMEKCKFLVLDGAHQGDSPSDVVAKCDITFSCVSDPEASKLLVFGSQGVLHGFEGSEAGSKGYIELSSNDPFTSEEIGKAISDAGGIYLEAPVSLSKHKDKLKIIAAGDRDFFNKCATYFQSISKDTYFVGSEVGSASKLNVIIGSLHGTLYGLLAESLKLAKKNNLSPKNFLSYLDQGADLPTHFLERGKAMIDHHFSVTTTLKHQQKLNSFALSLDAGNQSLSLAADKLSLNLDPNKSSPETDDKSMSQDADNKSSILNANNDSKYTKLLIAYCTQKVFNKAQEKYSDQDVSAVYMSI